MLAKILEDMWVEPEVLEALNEEQKRTLFLKMREEQVRRWREREERDEREGRNKDNTRSKKAFNKHVSWLLGRDGDVSISVIGEVDEFRSSKILHRLTNNRVRSDDVIEIQTADLQAERDAQEDDPTSPNRQSCEEDLDCCSADDDLKDQAEDSDSESGSSSDNHNEWALLYRPHSCSHSNQPSLKPQLSGTEMVGQEDREIVCCEENKFEHGSRVAQLRKVFVDDNQSTLPTNTKPPIPAKPAHLQKKGTTLHS